MSYIPAAEKFVSCLVIYDEYTNPLGIKRCKVKFGITRFCADKINVHEVVFHLQRKYAEPVRDINTYISTLISLTNLDAVVADNMVISHTAAHLVHSMHKHLSQPFGDYYTVPDEFMVVDTDRVPLTDPVQIEWAISRVREMLMSVIAASASKSHANRGKRSSKRSGKARGRTQTQEDTDRADAINDTDDCVAIETQIDGFIDDLVNIDDALAACDETDPMKQSLLAEKAATEAQLLRLTAELADLDESELDDRKLPGLTEA
jgi:hypothetical protein